MSNSAPPFPPINPYQPPNVDLQHFPTSQNQGEPTLCDPKKQSTDTGWAWIVRAWQLFKPRAGLWIGVMLSYVVVAIIMSFIPVLNILVGFLGIFYGAGIAYMAHQQAMGREVAFGQILYGFKGHALQLFLLVILMMLAAIVALIPLIVIIFSNMATFISFATPHTADSSLLTSSMVLGFLFCFLLSLLLFIPMAMAMWFAPILVVLHKLSAIDALKLSFKAGMKNVLPFLLYGIMVMLLSIVAIIPLALGFLVLSPVLSIARYTAYRSILTTPDLA